MVALCDCVGDGHPALLGSAALRAAQGDPGGKQAGQEAW